MSFKKLQGVKGGAGGCPCCGYTHEHLPMDKLIAVGFGYAAVTKNGEEVYNELDRENENTPLWTTKDAEIIAKQEPNNDWRIHLEAPLSERHYQRQDDGLWVLFEKGPGFA